MLSTQNIYIKKLLLEEARAVYIGHAHRDFPSDELKPFSMIEKLWEMGCYHAYGFYEEAGDALRAYAFIMADKDTETLLVDYFAVCEGGRGKGYGAAALALLKETCMEWDGIIFEVEDVDSAASDEERQTRRRRISFYENNGVIMTDTRSFAFGVDYRLMVMPLKSGMAAGQVGEKLSAIYKKMLPEHIYKKAFGIR